MTTSAQYILALGEKLALHFAVAVDGSTSVGFAPITEKSFGDEKTALKIFNNATDAENEKNRLCEVAVDMLSVRSTRTDFVPHDLETYCALEVQPYERVLEVA